MARWTPGWLTNLSAIMAALGIYCTKYDRITDVLTMSPNLEINMLSEYIYIYI